MRKNICELSLTRKYAQLVTDISKVTVNHALISGKCLVQFVFDLVMLQCCSPPSYVKTTLFLVQTSFYTIRSFSKDFRFALKVAGHKFSWVQLTPS